MQMSNNNKWPNYEPSCIVIDLPFTYQQEDESSKCKNKRITNETKQIANDVIEATHTL